MCSNASQIPPISNIVVAVAACFAMRNSSIANILAPCAATHSHIRMFCAMSLVHALVNVGTHGTCLLHGSRD